MLAARTAFRLPFGAPEPAAFIRQRFFPQKRPVPGTDGSTAFLHRSATTHVLCQ
jgi:hypothetical protein